MTSLIVCLLLSGASALLGNKHKINDVIMKSRYYHVTSISSPLQWFRGEETLGISSGASDRNEYSTAIVSMEKM